MTNAASSLTLADINKRTEQQVDQICNILNEIKPVETQLIGEKMVKAISSAASLESIKGGSQLNFSETLGLLSCLGTLIQIVLQLIAQRREKNLPLTTKEIEHELAETTSQHSELNRESQFIVKQPALVSKVIAKAITQSTKDPQPR